MYSNSSGTVSGTINGSISFTGSTTKTLSQTVGKNEVYNLVFTSHGWAPEINVTVTVDGNQYTINTTAFDNTGWNIDNNIFTYTYEIPSGNEISITGSVGDNNGSGGTDVAIVLSDKTGTSTTDNTEEAVIYLGEEPAEKLSRTLSAPTWYQYIDVENLPDGVTNRTVTYTDENGTSQTYTGAVSYKYYIVEDPVPTGYESSVKYIIDGIESRDGFDVTDIEAGADNNTATITNKSTNEAVKLPETGGRGTFVYTVTGFAIAFISACCLYIKLKKQGGTMA
jgi:hypothetical protein